MDRQLKQTAFFVADGASRRHLGRHYKARGDQSARADVDRRNVVGRASEPAADAREVVSRLPVPLVHATAGRARPARVARVHEHHRDAAKEGLVLDQGPQLVEAPVVQPCPLAPLNLDPVPDAFEIFEGYRGSAAFGAGDDCLADAVGGVALEPRLLAAGTPERALRGTGAELLQGPAAGMVTAPDALNLFTRVGGAPVILLAQEDTPAARGPLSLRRLKAAVSRGGNP